MNDSPETLAGLSRLLADQARDLAQALSDPLEAPTYLDTVDRARRVDELAGQVLKLCVQQSRDVGHTWQELGDLLGVTRQAAFQRFGKPIDPRTGEPMDKTVRIVDAAERATAILTDLLDGNLAAARKSFNTQVLEALTDEVWANALATVAGLVGAFERFADGAPFVRRIGDLTVVDIPLRYEAGDMKGRIAFDADEKIAGIFILPPETP